MIKMRHHINVEEFNIDSGNCRIDQQVIPDKSLSTGHGRVMLETLNITLTNRYTKTHTHTHTYLYNVPLSDDMQYSKSSLYEFINQWNIAVHNPEMQHVSIFLYLGTFTFS